MNLIPELTEDISLDYLIPSTKGHGVCMAVLVDYLVQTHNDFIGICNTVLSEEQERYIHIRTGNCVVS